MVKVTVSPSTLPSVMVDLPVNELVVSPVTLLPSCLKVNVRSIAPFGPSAVAFQLPLMSAAHALKANSANNAGSHFILQAPFNSRQYTLGQALALSQQSSNVLFGQSRNVLLTGSSLEGGRRTTTDDPGRARPAGGLEEGPEETDHAEAGCRGDRHHRAAGAATPAEAAAERRPGGNP